MNLYKFSVLFVAISLLTFPSVHASEEDAPTEKMSRTRYITSGIVGTYAGFGLGHAIQGRWSEKGYKMTLGQVGGFGLMLIGTIDCSLDAISDDECNANLFWAGAWVMLGFKIWEIWDVWATPVQQDLIARFSIQPPINDRPALLAYRLEF